MNNDKELPPQEPATDNLDEFPKCYTCGKVGIGHEKTEYLFFCTEECERTFSLNEGHQNPEDIPNEY